MFLGFSTHDQPNQTCIVHEIKTSGWTEVDFSLSRHVIAVAVAVVVMVVVCVCVG